MLALDDIRHEFPILDRTIDGRQLIYLDSAATSQTPRCVVDAITDMYFRHKA
ncbi:MAG: aminotransferase class V-fold PLP-dependent enzyme, partial [Muribaculaceae bacterium]|nr:aminotransferase class V-fold PLP-dependent enzyme [Muribaculaceae bacterium]